MKYAVRVPATTANAGSGFDTIGIALSLYNELYFETEPDAAGITVEVTGEGEKEIKSDKENLILSAMARTAEKAGRSLPGGHMREVNRIPFARGLGSSSAAIVGGIFLANLLMGEPFGKEEMLEIAAGMEGHPDNAAPAIYGKLRISLMEGKRVITTDMEVPEEWRAVVAVPDFEVRTSEARAILPKEIPFADAVHNLGAVAFLLSAFLHREPSFLKQGFNDRLHVPYRMRLIPGGREVVEAAIENGAYNATISGSGPTIIALCPQHAAESAGNAMTAAFGKAGLSAKYMNLSFDTIGVCAF